MRTSVKGGLSLLALASVVMGAAPAAAADSPVGTWVRTSEGGQPEITMTIQSWGIGHTKLGTATKEPRSVGTIMSNLDGADSPVVVNGKASTATVALTLVDQHQALMDTKLNGQIVGASKWTFSPDFTELTIEDDFSQAVPGTPAGKSTEHWTRR